MEERKSTNQLQFYTVRNHVQYGELPHLHQFVVVLSLQN